MIVITTMESLPEHCYECPCHDGESGYCQADKEQRYSDYRPFWCPLKEVKEAIKPTINEYREAFCVCGENVGIIPSSKNLPSIRSKYCSECGRRMNWND